MKNRYRKVIYALVIISCFLASSGCAHVTRHAVPEKLVGTAVVVGMPDLRYYTGKPVSPFMRQSLADSFKEEGKSDYLVDGIKTYPVLIIGGGVSNSAYGIGLLKGWTEEGSRPVFKIVTGYSSGSILATAIFAGKDYEDRLAVLFTSISTKDIVKDRGTFAILFGDSVNSSAPLAKKIDDIMGEDFMAKIAQEHKKGRRLYVGTTDFDAQGFVIWDMGALASRGDPDSVKMFRKIILASCSFPAMLPPVYFQVEAGGKRYDEMHVDGGVIGGVFYINQLMEGDGVRTQLYILNLCYMSRGIILVLPLSSATTREFSVFPPPRDFSITVVSLPMMTPVVSTTAPTGDVAFGFASAANDNDTAIITTRTAIKIFFTYITSLSFLKF